MVRPLPAEIYEFQSGLVDAFRRLRSGSTIGKVVIRVQGMQGDIGIAVITGGLGGLGLVTAETLVDMGADHVVLVSRSGRAKDYEGQNLQDRLTGLLDLNDGGLVSVECCDMSDEAVVACLLDTIRERHGGINTIVHASGVLADGLLFGMDSESVRRSFGPKAAGAWYLHKHSMEDEIRHFVMYSSISATFGNVGQTNYAASNLYLDALVRVRQMQGLPGASIQWPSIAEVGMAAAMDGIEEEDMLDLMSVKNTLKQATVSSGGVADEERVKIPLPQSWLMEDSFPARLRPFVSEVAIKNTQAVLSNTRSRRDDHMRSKMWSMEEVRSEVEAAVRMVIATEDNSTIDHNSSLMDMGLDSLGSVELVRSLEMRFGLELSSTLVFNKPSIRDLSEYIYSLVSLDVNVDDKAGYSANTYRDSMPVVDASEWSVIGMSCRFPGGVSGPDSFWDLMSAGKKTSTGIPYDRWDSEAFLAGMGLSKEESMRASYGSFVTDMESFDAGFFGISLAEAKAMDPQQRALLECAYLAFNDAGYTMEGLRGLNCGVFVGVTTNGKATKSCLLYTSPSPRDRG